MARNMGANKDTAQNAAKKLPCTRCGVWYKKDMMDNHSPCNGKDRWGDVFKQNPLNHKFLGDK